MRLQFVKWTFEIQFDLWSELGGWCGSSGACASVHAHNIGRLCSRARQPSLSLSSSRTLSISVEFCHHFSYGHQQWISSHMWSHLVQPILDTLVLISEPHTAGPCQPWISTWLSLSQESCILHTQISWQRQRYKRWDNIINLSFEKIFLNALEFLSGVDI